MFLRINEFAWGLTLTSVFTIDIFYKKNGIFPLFAEHNYAVIMSKKGVNYHATYYAY